jgi:ribose 5-phosphate isomerase B
VLAELGLDFEDLGCHSESSVDYPDYGIEVAEGVAAGKYDRGILVCGTGIGMSIVANKVPGVRCAVAHDTFTARATREHNDSNILALGARVIGPGLAEEVVRTWLTTAFHGGRHVRRLEKIAEIEKRYCRNGKK